jgi:hypothetical protein
MALQHIVVLSLVISSSSNAYRRSDADDDDYQPVVEVSQPVVHRDAGIKLRIPRLDLFSHPWFSAEKASQHLLEENARMNVLLRSPVMDDVVQEQAQRRSQEFNKHLREERARAKQLVSSISRINNRIQAEPRIGGSFDDVSPFSLLQISRKANISTDVITDWTFCTCGTGMNGTLTLPERVFPTPKASLLQVRVQGRQLSLEPNASCDCVNPWEEFKDTTGSSTCTLSNGVTVCLVHVNGANYMHSPEQIHAEARQLLTAINSTFAAANSFFQIWKPFQYQF